MEKDIKVTCPIGNLMRISSEPAIKNQSRIEIAKETLKRKRTTQSELPPNKFRKDSDEINVQWARAQLEKQEFALENEFTLPCILLYVYVV